MAEQLVQLTGTTAQWTANNIILLKGQFGYDSDLNIVKMGNGASTWSALPSIGGSAAVDPYRMSRSQMWRIFWAGTIIQGDGISTFAQNDSSTVVAAGIAGTSTTSRLNSLARFMGAATAVDRDAGINTNAAQIKLNTPLPYGRFPIGLLGMGFTDSSPTLGTAWYGFSVGAVTPATVEPSAFTVDHFGFGFDTTDANWQIYYKIAGGTSVKVNTGFVRTTDKGYFGTIDKNDDGTVLTFTLTDINTATTFTHTSAVQTAPGNAVYTDFRWCRTSKGSAFQPWSMFCNATVGRS